MRSKKPKTSGAYCNEFEDVPAKHRSNWPVHIRAQTQGYMCNSELHMSLLNSLFNLTYAKDEMEVSSNSSVPID